MTREQYLMMREKQNFNIIFEYYKEKFDLKKHTPFLQIEQLAQLLPMFGNINVVFDNCCKYYDEKFNVTILSDKNGNYIKAL